MSPRGRKATQPDQPHHRPGPLRLPGLVVEHLDRQGQSHAYDFGTLPLEPAMAESWTRSFAGYCAPGGGWDSLASSQQIWMVLSRFARFLAEQDQPVNDVDELTPEQWTAWRLSRTANSIGYLEVTKVAMFLRADARVRDDTRAALAKRIPQVKPKEKAFTPEEFVSIRSAAAKDLRAARLRIQENTEILDAWRTGRLAPGTDQWLLGEALDMLARTGDVPFYQGSDGRRRVVRRYERVLGGIDSSACWQRLFLTKAEAAALAVLFAAEFGLNATTIHEMPVPRATPDSGEGGAATYRLVLEKRRRHGGRQFETRNVTDLGGDTPGRLITHALAVTAHARALAAAEGSDIDRLLAWRTGRNASPSQNPMTERAGLIGLGLDQTAASYWAAAKGFGKIGVMRRMRKTVNVLHRREPGQNTQDTHDRVYVMGEPQAQQAAFPVIVEGAMEAVEKAQRMVRAELTETRREGDEETATVDCGGLHSGPFTPDGTACDASFLLCLACPNARIAPHHHPRLTLLHRALDNLRGVLKESVWEAEWADAHGRLDDLRRRLGEAAWQAAASAVSPADRALIDDLLNGLFD